MTFFFAVENIDELADDLNLSCNGGLCDVEGRVRDLYEERSKRPGLMEYGKNGRFWCCQYAEWCCQYAENRFEVSPVDVFNFLTIASHENSNPDSENLDEIKINGSHYISSLPKRVVETKMIRGLAHSNTLKYFNLLKECNLIEAICSKLIQFEKIKIMVNGIPYIQDFELFIAENFSELNTFTYKNIMKLLFSYNFVLKSASSSMILKTETITDSTESTTPESVEEDSAEPTRVILDSTDWPWS